MKKVIMGLAATVMLFTMGCEDEIFDEEAQLRTDIALIDEFLEENNLQAEEIGDTGIHIIVSNEGNGDAAKKGDSVFLHYTGYLLDGTQFDTSEGRGVFDFVLEKSDGGVIEGWDIAIKGLKEDAIATFFLPSAYGYGESARSNIPANSVLVFDVQITDIR